LQAVFLLKMSARVHKSASRTCSPQARVWGDLHYTVLAVWRRSEVGSHTSLANVDCSEEQVSVEMYSEDLPTLNQVTDHSCLGFNRW